VGLTLSSLAAILPTELAAVDQRDDVTADAELV